MENKIIEAVKTANTIDYSGNHKVNAKPDIWYIRNDDTLFFKTPERNTMNRYCLIKFDNDDIYEAFNGGDYDPETISYGYYLDDLLARNNNRKPLKFLDRYIDTNLDPSFNKKGECA